MKKELKVRVIPSEDRPIDKRIESLEHELPKIPSNIFLLGSCGSGKSCALYTMMSDGYTHKGKSIFDEVVVFLGSKDSEASWENGIKCDNKVILFDFDADDFFEYIKDLEEHQMERLKAKKQRLNVAMVFDDFVGQGLMKPYNGKASLLARVMLKSRHELNLTLFFCSQTYKDRSFTVPAVRNNLNYIFCFSMAASDFFKVAEENEEYYDKKELIEMYNEIHSQPNQFLLIDKKKPIRSPERFRHGFTTLLPPPKHLTPK